MFVHLPCYDLYVNVMQHYDFTQTRTWKNHLIYNIEVMLVTVVEL